MEAVPVEDQGTQADGVAILEMSGKLMGGPDAEAFNEMLKTLIHEGCHNVIVNLEKVQLGQQHRPGHPDLRLHDAQEERAAS